MANTEQSSDVECRKRSRNESELDNDNEPAQKKTKLDPCEIISKFITNWNSSPQYCVNAIIDVINQNLVSEQLINSYFKIQYKKTQPYSYAHVDPRRTLLLQIIYNINKLHRRSKLDIKSLTSLKTLLILVLNNGANPMLTQ
eukprot:403341_1